MNEAGLFQLPLIGILRVSSDENPPGEAPSHETPTTGQTIVFDDHYGMATFTSAKHPDIISSEKLSGVCSPMTTPPAIDKQNITKYGAAGRPILRMGIHEEPPKRLACRDSMSTGWNHTFDAPSSWAYDAHVPIENCNKLGPYSR